MLDRSGMIAFREIPRDETTPAAPQHPDARDLAAHELTGMTTGRPDQVVEARGRGAFGEAGQDRMEVFRHRLGRRGNLRDAGNGGRIGHERHANIPSEDRQGSPAAA